MKLALTAAACASPPWSRRSSAARCPGGTAQHHHPRPYMHVKRPNSVYSFPRRALTLCQQLCMGILPGARFPARSADALPSSLYGQFTQAIYRNRPIPLALHQLAITHLPCSFTRLHQLQIKEEHNPLHRGRNHSIPCVKREKKHCP